jgi:hypothetical protein
MTSNPIRREQQHIYALKRGEHRAENMQADAVKYGIEHFKMRILEVKEDRREALDTEQRYMYLFQTYHPDTGYNGKDYLFQESWERVQKNRIPDNIITSTIRRKTSKTFEGMRWAIGINSMSKKEFYAKLYNPRLFSEDELSIIAKELKLDINKIQQELA